MGTQLSNAPRSTLFMQDPADFTIVMTPGKPFYHKRVHRPLNPALVESIKEFGVLEPVIATKVGDELVIVAGRRRVLHSRAAIEKYPELKGTLKVPTLIRRGDEVRLEAVGFAENEGRLEDDPITRAENMAALYDRCGDMAAVAKAFCCTTVSVQQTMKLLDMAPAIKKALLSETISQAAAIALYGLPVKEQETKLSEMLAAGRTSAADAKRLVRVDTQGDDEEKTSADDTTPKKAKSDDAFASKPPMKLLRRLAEVLEEEPAGEDDFVALLKWVTGEISEESAYKKLKWLRDAVKVAQTDRRRTAKADESEPEAKPKAPKKVKADTDESKAPKASPPKAPKAAKASKKGS